MKLQHEMGRKSFILSTVSLDTSVIIVEFITLRIQRISFYMTMTLISLFRSPSSPNTKTRKVLLPMHHPALPVNVNHEPFDFDCYLTSYILFSSEIEKKIAH